MPITAQHTSELTVIGQLNSVGDIYPTQNGRFMVGLTLWTASGQGEQQSFTNYDAVRFLQSEETAQAFRERALANMKSTIYVSGSNVTMEVNAEIKEIEVDGKTKKKLVTYASVHMVANTIRFFNIKQERAQQTGSVDDLDLDGVEID